MGTRATADLVKETSTRPDKENVMRHNNVNLKPVGDEKPFVFSITAAYPGRCIRRRISLPATDEDAAAIVERLAKPIRQTRTNRIRREEL